MFQNQILPFNNVAMNGKSPGTVTFGFAPRWTPADLLANQLTRRRVVREINPRCALPPAPGG